MLLHKRDVTCNFLVSKVLPIRLLRPGIPLTGKDAAPARHFEAGTHPADAGKEIDESERSRPIGFCGAHPKNLAQGGFHEKRNLRLALLPPSNGSGSHTELICTHTLCELPPASVRRFKGSRSRMGAMGISGDRMSDCCPRAHIISKLAGELGPDPTNQQQNPNRQVSGPRGQVPARWVKIQVPWAGIENSPQDS